MEPIKVGDAVYIRRRVGMRRGVVARETKTRWVVKSGEGAYSFLKRTLNEIGSGSSFDAAYITPRTPETDAAYRESLALVKLYHLEKAVLDHKRSRQNAGAVRIAYLAWEKLALASESKAASPERPNRSDATKEGTPENP